MHWLAIWSLADHSAYTGIDEDDGNAVVHWIQLHEVHVEAAIVIRSVVRNVCMAYVCTALGRANPIPPGPVMPWFLPRMGFVGHLVKGPKGLVAVASPTA